MATAERRVARELQECMSSPPVGMMITLPSETDLYHWSVTLAGPPASVYSGGTFTLSVNLPPDYPFKAPQVTFVTRIYHPNVTNDSVGSICLSILKPENWKPASRVRAVLDSIRQLLIEPNPDDPLEPRIAEEFKNNPREFEKNARAYVARYAQPQSQQSQQQPTKK